MPAEEHMALQRKIFEYGWNKGDMEALDELLAPDYISHIAANPNETREEFKQRIAMLRTAFPDLVVTIDDMFGEGEKLVTLWTARGTHRGTLMGVPATGTRIEMRGIGLDRIVGGKRVESWAEMDMFGVLQQIGIIPQPGRARA